MSLTVIVRCPIVIIVTDEMQANAEVVTCRMPLHTGKWSREGGNVYPSSVHVICVGY